MKRLILLVLSVMSAGILMSAVRSVDEAAGLAGSFLTAQAPARDASSSIPALQYVVEQEDGEAAAYVFALNGEGFVIVSADDQAKTILGYSDEGSFDSAHIPSSMQYWLDTYARQISSIQGKEAEQPLQNNHRSRVADFGATKPMTLGDEIGRRSVSTLAQAPARMVASGAAVAPMLGNIMWDQGTPFNNQCPNDPDDPSKKCYTGCVATATAQVMRLWEYPARGTGSRSYEWVHDFQGSQGVLSANFNTTFDWTNMREDYNGTYTSTQATAVAKLMKYVGIASEMSYGGYSTGGSAAVVGEAVQGLKTYFDYYRGAECLSPKYMGQAAFESALENEIRAGRPVIMGGATIYNEGHCFVCDGIDANGLFHINWGWGGYSNGYFVISALDPAQQGMGGAASNEGFNLDVEAFIYIAPQPAGNTDEEVVQLGTDLQWMNADTLYPGDELWVYMDILENYGCTTYTGLVGVCIANEDGTSIVDWIDCRGVDSLAPGWYLYNVWWGMNLPNLSDGNYLLLPLQEGTSSWEVISQTNDLIRFTVTNGVAVLGGQPQSGEDGDDEGEGDGDGDDDPDPIIPTPETPDTITITELDYLDAYYCTTGSDYYWIMNIYSGNYSANHLPYLRLYVWALDDKYHLVGTYDLISENGSYQLAGESVSHDLVEGTFTITRMPGTDDYYNLPNYTVQGVLTDADSNVIILNALVCGDGYDWLEDDKIQVELQDEVEDVPSQLMQTGAPEPATKALRNGRIVIRRERTNYDILGNTINLH